MKNKDLAIYTLIALIGIALLTLLFANFKYIAPSNIEGKIKDAGGSSKNEVISTFTGGNVSDSNSLELSK